MRTQIVALAVIAILLAGCAGGPGAPPSPQQIPSPGANGRYTDVNGTRLYYEIAGPANAEVIVLVHQFTMDARMWDDQWSEFSRRYRVIRYDARGFGRSGPIRGAYSVREDLRALLDSLGVARAHIVGLSMGARYAADFALAHPARVRTLVLADPTVAGMRFSSGFTKEFGEATAAARSGDFDEAKRRWLASSLFAATRDKPGVMKRVRDIVGGYSGWHFANNDPATPLAPPAAQQLTRLKVPTLVLVGERSLPDVLNMADRIYRDLPVARRVVLKDAGHMANMESPGAFNRAVLEFVGRPPIEALPDRARASDTAPCVDPKTKRPAPCR